MNGSSQSLLPRQGLTGTRDELPDPEQPVIAVTPKFRCLATRGKDGFWHYEPTKEKLDSVIGWLPIEA